MTVAAVPPAPPVAELLFGDRLPLAVAYAERLAIGGVERGLLGPREVPRLWERHLLNSAVLADLIPSGVRVADVGSGAGLPGIPLVLRRPDLTVDLVEPMLRRVRFLDEVVAELGVGSQVRVVRGRAEEPAVRRAVGAVHNVVARAVAPLDRLVKWSLPLLVPGGELLALKGASAAGEVARHRMVIGQAGGEVLAVEALGAVTLAEPTWVVRVRRRPRPEEG